MKLTSRLSFPFAFLTGLLWAVHALALDPARSIAQYTHTKWTIADGAPPDIAAIVQSADGYLWLGTSTGLYRFDGITFEQIPPIEGDTSRSEAITALLALPSGDVWVGYYYGGIAVYHDGKLHDFNHGPPEGVVRGFAQDEDGGIWVATFGLKHAGVSRYADGKWQSFDAASGVPPEPLMEISASRDGAVWLVTQESILVLRHGSARFERAGAGPSLLAQDGFGLGKVGVATDPQGRGWISDCAGVRLLDQRAEPATSKDGSAAAGPCPRGGGIPRAIVFDRDGNIWGTTWAEGILRIRPPGPAPGPGPETNFPPGVGDTFHAADGLSSNTTQAVVEDREGDIWIGTSSGLDRFRTANVVVETAIPPPAESFYRAARDAAGTVYFANGRSVYQTLPGAEPAAVSDVLPNLGAFFCRTTDGRVLIGSRTGDLDELYDGYLKKYLSSAKSFPSDSNGCAIDKYGTLWIWTAAHGLYRIDDNGPKEFAVFEDNSHIHPHSAALDDQGRLLLFFGRRALIRVDGERIETLLTASDIKIGLVEVIAQGPHYLLLGGERGLLQFDGDHARMLLSLQYPWLKNITGIAQTGRGETWLIGIDKIIRLSTAELEQAFADPGRSPLHYELFDANDGLPNFSIIGGNTGDVSNAVEGGDGRIWLPVTDHLAWIDPVHLTRNPLQPPVSIQRLIANDRPYSLPLSGALPKGVSKLEIDYTALSLSFPQRNRFRYRLDGVDDDWVDPGTRRQAFYTNLGPGHYRFTVIAANNDGVWNKTGATLAFDIPPTFLQSKLFLALCIALALALAWLLYSLRLRQMAVRIRGRLEARLEERERIARELHDTLLQGFQGLLLRFQAVADEIPVEHPTHGKMENALERAEDVLVEGRDRVRDLRTAEAKGELSRMLADAADKLEFDPQISVRVIVEGAPRDLHLVVCDEIVAIGKEALFNISCHAKAKAIEIYIRHDRKQLDVKFIDDGVGIDQAMLQQGREGHFGLTGMRERAAKIRASFVVTSRIGAGTEIALAVPASVAYARNGKNLWRWPLRQPEPREG